MRTLIAVSLLALSVAGVRAQEQEKKLVDRLLRPDLTLQNSAQDKRFIAANRSRVNKQAPVVEFFVRENHLVKSYPGERKVAGKDFAVAQFRGGDGVARNSRKSHRTKSAGVQANSHLASRNASAGRAVTTSEFAQTRPFLVQGKSQKALSQQNKPLTIDQVRELLNKNK